MKNKLYIIIAFVVFLLASFYTFNNYIYHEKQADPNQPPVSYRGTLTGEHLCVPHKNTSGDQTFECMFGLKTDTGEFYAVDFNMMAVKDINIQIGDRFSANGIITPIEMLSTDQWEKYSITGIFSVTDSVQKL